MIFIINFYLLMFISLKDYFSVFLFINNKIYNINKIYIFVPNSLPLINFFIMNHIIG